MFCSLESNDSFRHSANFSGSDRGEEGGATEATVRVYGQLRQMSFSVNVNGLKN